MGAFCGCDAPLSPIGGDLYQWDQERFTAVPPGFSQVHYTNCPDAKSTPYNVEVHDGKAIIPSELLMDDKPIFAWVTDGIRTYGKARWRVHPRPRPADYKYTASELMGLESIHEWIREEAARYSDYDNLTNKPSINGHELEGDSSLNDLGLSFADDEEVKTIFEQKG